MSKNLTKWGIGVAVLTTVAPAWAVAVNKDGTGYTKPDAGGDSPPAHVVVDDYTTTIYPNSDLKSSADVCADATLSESAFKGEIEDVVHEDISGWSKTAFGITVKLSRTEVSFSCDAHESPEYDTCIAMAKLAYDNCSGITTYGKIVSGANLAACYTTYQNALAHCESEYGDDAYELSNVKVDGHVTINDTDGTFAISGNASVSHVGGREQHCLTNLSLSSWNNGHVMSNAAQNYLSDYLKTSSICW